MNRNSHSISSEIIRSISVCMASLLIVALLIVPFMGSTPVQAARQSQLQWSIVDTPSIDNAIVVPSEINAIAIGPDNQTMYAVDIPRSKLYKSTDAGVTWKDGMAGLTVLDPNLHVWDISIASDDVNFVAAVTNDTAAPDGPKRVYVSTDGGNNWQSAGFPSPLPALPGDEYISCLAISMPYDTDKRDIAIATRSVAGNGRVFVMKVPGFGIWKDQTDLPSTGWVNGDVVALKFSPGYETDLSIVVLYASTAGLYLNLGYHDIVANNTAWRTGINFPIKIVASSGLSPKYDQIITADLQLPFDFSADDLTGLRRFFVSFDARVGIGGNHFSGIYRIDDVTVIQLLYSEADYQRVSSIAYMGTYDSGTLHAGITASAPGTCVVPVWHCLNPFSVSPMPGWQLSDNIKSPTGGAGLASGRANARVLWDTSGDVIYCATSSANLTDGRTGVGAQWPQGLLIPVTLDESAFSISRDGGNTWNQISLIDTGINRLADVAVIEEVDNEEQKNPYDVLYLASLNTAAAGFDSLWRSISDPLGLRWERVLCTKSKYDDMILRINPRIVGSGERSSVIVFADRLTEDVRYSANEGQSWMQLFPGSTVKDISLASDAVMYAGADTFIKRGSFNGLSWQWSDKVVTGFETLHTIATPLKNPNPKQNIVEDWVVVGDELNGDVVYADFSAKVVRFGPSSDLRKLLPVRGEVHVTCDDQFNVNKTIYAAVSDGRGKIYRWVIGQSSLWEELGPPDSDFYGLVHQQGVLYGAFDRSQRPDTMKGMDRTLYSHDRVPPSVDWDSLIEGLPGPPPSVKFTGEPSSLKISGIAVNNLWAIDNRGYNWLAEEGCLWIYVDSLAKVGPWTTAPASDSIIPFDSVTGRANEVNFAWRSLSYVRDYEIQIAKDDKFTLMLIESGTITPADPVSPAWIVFPGPLEAGHKYYWRARASRAIAADTSKDGEGEVIHSPWSATMYFTAMSGLPVTAKHLGPTILNPANSACDVSTTPSFSWSPIPAATEYEFTLASDAAMTTVIDKAKVTTTACQYVGGLTANQTYFWQVRATRPMPSEYSPIASFTVGERLDAVPAPRGILPEDAVPLLIWIGIIEYALLGISIILFIKSREGSGREN